MQAYMGYAYVICCTPGQLYRLILLTARISVKRSSTRRRHGEGCKGTRMPPISARNVRRVAIDSWQSGGGNGRLPLTIGHGCSSPSGSKKKGTGVNLCPGP